VGALVPSPLSTAWGTTEAVPAAKAARSTTPRTRRRRRLRGKRHPRSPRRRMPRPRPGVGGTSCVGPSRPDVGPPSRAIQVLRAVGEGVGVAPPTVPRKAGPPIPLRLSLGAVQTQAYASEERLSVGPGGQHHGCQYCARPGRTWAGPSAPKTCPGHGSVDRSRSSTHASSPRRMLEPSAEPRRTRAARAPNPPRLGSRRRRHRVAGKAAGVGRQSHGCPRSVGPPANTAEHHDHRSGLGVDQASVLSLPSPCRALLPDR
jgi:hypothetical protein